MAMIRELRVRNLAIVEEFSIELAPGLNVLTGETGAGKSLLIDSLEFLNGARGSTESIRSGEEKMSAEAVFELPEQYREFLEESGIEPELDGPSVQIIVRRELGASGRGRVVVNGTPLAVRELQSVTSPLLEIHGQTQSHGRIAGRTFLDLLDRFANNESALTRVGAIYEQWKTIAAKRNEFLEAHRNRSLKVDVLRFQIEELQSPALEKDEEEALRKERALLVNAQETLEATQGAIVMLDDDESSATSQIARASSLLHPLARKIGEVERLAAELDEVRYRLEDVIRSIHALTSEVRHDPERVDFVESRLATIERLKKKYAAASVAELLEHLEKVRSEIEALDDYEGTLARLESEHSAVVADYSREAHQISESRRKASAKLEKAIQQELDDLAMSGARISISLQQTADSLSPVERNGKGVVFGPSGFDRVEILLQPNRGEELRPLHRIASGGELSRIQLAIAAALFRHSNMDGGATLVFDEIDAGIGGRVAGVVGKKLRDLAAKNQLLCVTHLPQIAAMGHAHFHVWKEETGTRTRARIAQLTTREQRVEEIGRMLGGERLTGSALAHAAELLDGIVVANDPTQGKRSGVHN